MVHFRWNERTDEIEYEEPRRKRRWRAPRSRTGLPWWSGVAVRLALLLGGICVLFQA